MAELEAELRPELYGWQIFVWLAMLPWTNLLISPQTITVSAVIGITIFYSDGEALEVAGPGGTLLAFVIIGIISICVLEGVSEMVQMFPAPNAIMEYIRAFVDPDLAWVMGVAYWYTFSSTFAILIIAAAEFSSFWHLAQVWQTIGFYGFAPVVMLFINFAGVKYFGYVETVGGILKIFMVIGGGIYMYIIHGKEETGSTYINKGFTNNPRFAKNKKIAGCYVIPIVAYGFISLESIAVTAFEARDLNSLRKSSQLVAYFIFGLYVFILVGELMNVDWTNRALPQIYGGIDADYTGVRTEPSRSQAIVIIAALRAGSPKISGLLNGCMIFSALSASNTALYIASRSLYGMTRTISPWRWFAWLRELGTVWHRTGVPMWALLVSALAFVWLPFLELQGGHNIATWIEIMSISSSVSCLLVWASLCLAFIRYHAWLKKHRDAIAVSYPEHNRWAKTSQASTFLAGLQPALAWLGFIACLVIVFVFTTATWWSTRPMFTKIATAYGSPVVLTVFFILLKLITRRLPVRLDDDSAALFSTLEHLRYLKPERRTT